MGDATVKASITNTKTMPKPKSKPQLKLINRLRGHVPAGLWRNMPSLIIMGCAILGLIASPFIVGADSYQDKINALNAQNAQSQQNLNGLQLQAKSYQDAINQLQVQIAAIRAAIAANQAQQAALQQQIDANQQKLDEQRSVLANDVKTMYVNGQMSNVEMWATSDNLSDYVDKQQAYSSLQDAIQNTMDKITQLQKQLQTSKDQLDVSLKTEQAQNDQVSAYEAQQSQLLAMNQGQQDQYNQQISNNNSQIARLRAEQAAANASIARSAHVVGASGGSGGLCDIGQGNGGYPMSWCNASWDFDYTPADANGFPERQCTSFAYWYFTSMEGQTGFSVSGNAGWWYLTSNYAATTYPDVKVGAIGVEPSSSLNAPVPSLHGGYYGHVMIVLALPGQTYGGQYVPSGYVLVSSMNEDERGHFMYNLWPADYLMYINPR